MSWANLMLLCATAVYVLHGVLGATRFLWSRQVGRAQAGMTALLAVALALHTGFLVWRGTQVGGLPVETRLDSVALFLWLTALAFLGACRPYRLGGIASLFWPLYAGGAVAMWVLCPPRAEPRGSLERAWLLLHLIPVYVGYAGFAVAAGAGLAYLLQERLLRRKGRMGLWRQLPALETLERADRTALSLGFPMLTLGLVAGVFWAERSSARLGQAWYADPKVVGGIAVWLFYAAVLHIRLFARLRGRRAALLTLAGFVLTLASFATAHAYASAQGRTGSGSRPRVEARVDV